jgi:hypothetical protein
VSTWLVVVLLILASYRVTRLIVYDDFPPIFWLRSKITYARPPITRTDKVWDYRTGQWQWGDSEIDYWWLGELVNCPWCTSAYVSGAGVLIMWAVYGMPLPILVWLAVWGGSAALAAKIK